MDYLGYMGGKDYLNLASEVWLSTEIRPTPSDITQELQQAVQALPSRSLTDALVQNFLSVVNYNYNAIYPPTFLEGYTNWWADRAAKRPLSPEYTCLLLRSCALSTQAMPSKLRNTLEFELAEDPTTLPDRFHQAAELLSSNFSPGEKGLIQIQQLFLVVCWFKNAGRFIDSWHAMAKCVREAQEMKLHLDDSMMEMSEYEREMRRRMMTIIFVWDWLMSRWLSRPLLVDPVSCTFRDPTLQLESDPENPGVPSPFTNLTLQSKLIRSVSDSLSRAQRDPSEANVKDLCARVDRWHADLPPAWRRDNPDTTFDVRYPYLKWQRILLHGTVAMVEMVPTKPYLTGSASSQSRATQQYFRSFAVERALTSLREAEKAYELMKDLDPRHFYINFVLFDTLTILCSGMIHDDNKDLPHRSAVLDAIETAMRPLKEISLCSAPGATSYQFVLRLAQCMPLTPEEQVRWPFHHANKAKRSRRERSPQPMSTTKSSVEAEEGSPSTLHSTGSGAGSGSGSGSDQNSPPVQVPSLEDFQEIDFGGIEELWDWNALNIENLDPGSAEEINFTGFGGSTSN
ncbi:uncharacterized protein AB675_10017 [Cyphellophora attinorum]|uniref:Xylanolytic transcriptional activator regulatory domain-containing protein n=1 Tax=Cyphellophora attinorum TaxID=1664694 RepID=A0A0N0NJ66_9EURO|nr:uncharacterized protein AB675_10017 [Phialophora attinorum]KPI36631.1 hypothetical protein AB675_10017 [Phialophora attinorum]